MANLLNFTHDQIAAQLTDGYWQSKGYARHSFDVRAGETLTVNVMGLTDAGQELARWALAAWSSVSGINFSFVTATASITFDDSQAGAFSSYWYSGSTTTSATVNVSADWLAAYGTTFNSYSLQTYIHEIGHALGLGHAGNYNGAATYGVHNHYANDSWQATVMSYFDQTDNTSVDASYAFVTSPMIADIIAIQNLYGKASSNVGNDTYFFQNSIGAPTAKTVFDTAGFDTFDFSAVTTDQYINLTEESYSNIGGLIGNLGVGRGTIIEGVVGGSSGDTIIGNTADNRIHGRGGDDILHGNGGSDTAVFTSRQGSVSIYRFLEGAVASSVEGNDQLFGMERLSFADGSRDLNSLTTIGSIYEYGASHGDLIVALGASEKSLISHFAAFGLREGRATTFEAELYLGAYGDLRVAFGKDIAAAAKHFITDGFHEGRSFLAFNALEYIASYGDLIAAYGAVAQAGLSHFKQYGFGEGRADLFDGLRYIASYGDLIQAYHSDANAGAEHYINYGFKENRPAAFDPDAYMHAAGNGDLIAAFGNDYELVTRHYIDYGYYEGRLLA